MAKIHIIGGPGSGKTTLAREIASHLHIPHYDLDTVNWEQENPVALASQPAWVTEGIYLIFTEPMLYRADYIVLLEVSWPVAAWRIISRHIMNSLRGTNQYPGINGIKLLFKLLKHTREYILNLEPVDASSVETLRQYLETHREMIAPPTEEFVKAYEAEFARFACPPTQDFVRMYLERFKEKVILSKNKADRERLLELLTKEYSNETLQSVE